MLQPGVTSFRSPADHRKYLEEQLSEMLGPFNLWVAGQTLGHSPSDSEAVKHYIENGGAEDFAHRHGLT